MELGELTSFNAIPDSKDLSRTDSGSKKTRRLALDHKPANGQQIITWETKKCPESRTHPISRNDAVSIESWLYVRLGL